MRQRFLVMPRPQLKDPYPDRQAPSPMISPSSIKPNVYVYHRRGFFLQVRLQHKDMYNYADSPSTPLNTPSSTTAQLRQVHLRNVYVFKRCTTTIAVDLTRLRVPLLPSTNSFRPKNARFKDEFNIGVAGQEDMEPLQDAKDKNWQKLELIAQKYHNWGITCRLIPFFVIFTCQYQVWG